MNAMVMRGMFVSVFSSAVTGAQTQGPAPAKPEPEPTGESSSTLSSGLYGSLACRISNMAGNIETTGKGYKR